MCSLIHTMLHHEQGSCVLELTGIPFYSLQATASITAQNFLAPADDLGYKVEYRHPYFFSSKDPKRTALAVSIFNARKLSGVFTPGMLRHCPWNLLLLFADC